MASAIAGTPCPMKLTAALPERSRYFLPALSHIHAPSPRTATGNALRKERVNNALWPGLAEGIQRLSASNRLGGKRDREFVNLRVLRGYLFSALSFSRNTNFSPDHT